MVTPNGAPPASSSSSAAPATSPASSPAREYNFAAVVVGPPQAGKTTIVRGLVIEHLQRYPTGLALVHDPNRQFRDICQTWETADAWRAAIAAAAAKKAPFPAGASIGGAASDLTKVAIELGRARNTAGNVRIPILLAYDESSLMGTSGTSYIGELDTQLLSNRRHWGIGPVYNVQRPTALTEAFYSMATDVYILTQPSPRRTAVIEEYLGLPPDALAELVGAERFRYRHWQAGKGLV